MKKKLGIIEEFKKFITYGKIYTTVDESIIFLSKMWEEHYEKQANFSPITS